MCGRYQRKPGKQKIAEAFHVRHDIAGISIPPEDLNITPFSMQPVIRANRDDGEREMVLMQWSMVPLNTKDPGTLKGRNMFNARADSVATTRAWRVPFKKRRCIIPASGFYEWHNLNAPAKQPYTFSLTGGELFGFAGIWDAWRDSKGDWLQSFAIISTEPNEMMAHIHNRMPVILHPRDYDLWLSRDETEQPPLDLLRPYEAEGMDIVEGGPPVLEPRRKGPIAFHTTTSFGPTE